MLKVLEALSAVFPGFQINLTSDQNVPQFAHFNTDERRESCKSICIGGAGFAQRIRRLAPRDTEVVITRLELDDRRG